MNAEFGMRISPVFPGHRKTDSNSLSEAQSRTTVLSKSRNRPICVTFHVNSGGLIPFIRTPFYNIFQQRNPFGAKGGRGKFAPPPPLPARQKKRGIPASDRHFPASKPNAPKRPKLNDQVIYNQLIKAYNPFKIADYIKIYPVFYPTKRDKPVKFAIPARGGSPLSIRQGASFYMKASPRNSSKSSSTATRVISPKFLRLFWRKFITPCRLQTR